jgi:hypothetical protein
MVHVPTNGYQLSKVVYSVPWDIGENKVFFRIQDDISTSQQATSKQPKSHLINLQIKIELLWPRHAAAAVHVGPWSNCKTSKGSVFHQSAFCGIKASSSPEARHL